MQVSDELHRAYQIAKTKLKNAGVELRDIRPANEFADRETVDDGVTEHYCRSEYSVGHGRAIEVDVTSWCVDGETTFCSVAYMEDPYVEIAEFRW